MGIVYDTFPQLFHRLGIFSVENKWLIKYT